MADDMSRTGAGGASGQVPYGKDPREEGVAAEGDRPSTLSALWYTVSPFVLAIVAALLVRAFVTEPWIVPTGSMLDTIQLNDLIWAEKVTYLFSGPKQGDIVVFNSPYEEGVTLVKRVIATGGQTVDLVGGEVYVDGERLDEPYTGGKPTYPLDHQLAGVDEITYPYTVPEGHLWMMGDNRTNSRDSRYYGAVPLEEIKGRAVVVTWPLSDAKLL